MLKEMCEVIRIKAKKDGLLVVDYSTCCHVEGCGTCLGKYKSHYPYFKVKKE